jgi:hypothetical protein
LLNGKEIVGDQTIREIGEYKLELFLDNEIYQTINFSIVNDNLVQESESVNYIAYLKYLFLLLSIVGGVLILRKK